MTGEFELSALDGANPLGFLAALGTMVVLQSVGERGARLCWSRGVTWTPTVTGVSVLEQRAFCELVARGLAGREVSEEAAAERVDAARRYAAAKTAVKKKQEEIGKRRLARAEKQAAVEAELRPLQTEMHRAREAWLRALRSAVPRPELALGDRIDCTPDQYRQHAEAMLGDANAVDGLAMLAAFGTDACVTSGGVIEATPFQFLHGAGNQWFLRTALELMGRVTPAGVRRALFEPWTYSDRKLSMRWDPVEDRRYALSAADPGEAPAQTVWMANLLAYRALCLFPAAPRSRRLRVVGWANIRGETVFSWPLWEVPASIETIRSLLALREVVSDDPDRRALRARGVAVVFRSRRIKVGSGANHVVNFTPARAV